MPARAITIQRLSVGRGPHSGAVRLFRGSRSASSYVAPRLDAAACRGFHTPPRRSKDDFPERALARLDGGGRVACRLRDRYGSRSGKVTVKPGVSIGFMSSGERCCDP